MHYHLRSRLSVTVPACLLLVSLLTRVENMQYYLQQEWLYIGCSLTMVIFGLGRRGNSLMDVLLGILILLFAIATWLLGYHSLFFLTTLSVLVLLAAACTRKEVVLPLVLVWLTSPAFHSFLHGYSASIKQQLATWVYAVAGKMISIQSVGQGILHTSSGGITIDDGCMGLNMLKVNFLIAVMILFFKEHKMKVKHSIGQVFLLLSVSLVLNVVSNIFRIVILVWSGEIQDGFTHQAIGLICFTVYNVLPLIWITDRLRTKNLPEKESPATSSNPIVSIMASLALIILLIKPETANILLPVAQKIAARKNMSLQMISNDVIKLSDKKSIIYIKSVSHSPMICWTGDGYQILPQQTTRNYVHDQLIKDDQLLNSYWWYQCGVERTSSLADAIYKSVKSGQPIAIVNMAL